MQNQTTLFREILGHKLSAHFSKSNYTFNRTAIGDDNIYKKATGTTYDIQCGQEYKTICATLK